MSDNWKAELNTSSDSKVEGFVLNYIGSDMQSIDLFNVGFHAGNFVFDVEAIPDDMVVKKDNEIIITIELNGNTEEIALNEQ